MNDRELLKRAAEAAGLKIEYWTEDSTGEVPVAVLSDGDFWQPLLRNTHTDCMGDAMRLAVGLRMDLNINDDACDAFHPEGCVSEVGGESTADVVRRAIVRAAAEIRRTM